MPHFSRVTATLAVCLLAAAGEVALLLSNVNLPEPLSAGIAFLAFLVGPLVFLSVAVWRRRANPAHVRLLFIVALVISFIGLGVFAVRTAASDELLKSPALNPALVPLVQWLVVLAAWMRVNAIESREKRRR